MIDDRSGDVATLFRILQRHHVPSTDLLRFQFTGRREFERLLATDPATLTDLAGRLSGVNIENLDYAEFSARYDGPGVPFCLDPPYWGSEGDYGAGAFARSDFARLLMAPSTWVLVWPIACLLSLT